MISYIDKSGMVSGSGAGGVGVTVDVPYPPSVQPGDFLIIHAGSARGGTIGSISTTDPFISLGASSIFQSNVPAIAGNAVMLIKVADGTESGTVPVLAFSDDDVDVCATMYRYRQSTGQAIRIEDAVSKMDGNGNATVTWNGVTVGGNARTLLALSVQLGGQPATPAGYTQRAIDTDLGISLKLADAEDVGADGLITASGGLAAGWATHHVSLFSAAGRSFIVN